MNVTSSNMTVVLQYRDSFTKALVKNLIVVALTITINCTSGGLIHIYHKNQMFYTNPRYIFFIHLVINDMIQMTLANIIFIICYTVYRISVSICCTLMIPLILTSENTPLNLACMAIECYVAICHPLKQMRICTIKMTFVALGLIWMTTFFSVIPDVFITWATQPVGFFHSKAFCRRESVFPTPLLIQKRDITYMVFLVIVWITIFYTYFRILFTAKAADKDAKKARNTILLHGFQLLLSMSSYASAPLTVALLTWFPKDFTDSLFATFLLVQMLPRAISPLIYGLRDKNFRKYFKKNLLSLTNRD